MCTTTRKREGWRLRLRRRIMTLDSVPEPIAMKHLLLLTASLSLLPAPVRAGLYYSGERIAELPAQCRRFLADQRSLLALPLKPAPRLAPSTLQAEYKTPLAKLANKANPS